MGSSRVSTAFGVCRFIWFGIGDEKHVCNMKTGHKEDHVCPCSAESEWDEEEGYDNSE